MIDEQPNGRFITYLDGFVEPESLKDQFITIGGTLLKTEQGKVDQANYIYPVIKTNYYRVWKLSQSYYYPDDMWDDWAFSVDDRIIGMVSLKFAIISIN